MAVGVTSALILLVVAPSDLNPDAVFLAQLLVAVLAVIFLHGVSCLVALKGSRVDYSTHLGPLYTYPYKRLRPPYPDTITNVYTLLVGDIYLSVRKSKILGTGSALAPAQQVGEVSRKRDPPTMHGRASAFLKR